MGVEIPQGGEYPASTPIQETAPPADPKPQEKDISEQSSGKKWRNIGLVLFFSAVVLAVIVALVPDWGKKEAAKEAQTTSMQSAKAFAPILPVFGGEFP